MNPYEYAVKLVEVYDGDTVVLDIDLGFDVWLLRQRVRIAGIDAPELRTRDEAEKAMGVEAREFLRSLLAKRNLRVVSEKYNASEKFGRILGDIFFLEDGEWRSARDEMLAYGRGRAYDGGKR